MSSSYTYSDSTTFTVTHARHLAAKIATDLKRVQRLYGQPSDSRIAEFESEAIELMKGGYLEEVTYGFRKDDNWVEPTLRYTAKDIVSNGIDDDPGKVRPNLDISGATFFSSMKHSRAWYSLTEMARAAIEASLPIRRVTADPPKLQNGYFVDDKTYSAGGRALSRATMRSY